MKYKRNTKEYVKFFLFTLIENRFTCMIATCDFVTANCTEM